MGVLILFMQHMVPAFYVSCNEMMDKWAELVNKEGSCEVDVWPDVSYVFK